MNWDGEFRKMLRVFPQYMRLGNPLCEEDVAEVKKITRSPFDPLKTLPRAMQRLPAPLRNLRPVI